MMAEQNSQNRRALKMRDILNTFDEKLTLDVKKTRFLFRMKSADDNISRVKLCYEFLKRFGLLPKKPVDSKNDDTCAVFKSNGDNYYMKTENYEKALTSYNYALKHTSDPRHMKLIYGNRSAVLFSTNNYKECLMDIDRAFKSGYDDHLKPKLLNRKARAEEALIRLEDLKIEDSFDYDEVLKTYFELPDKRMRGVKCASASIRIYNFSSMGRGVIATENISAGTVLVKEKPFTSILTRHFHMSRCYFCLAQNKAMIACQKCAYVMFCDEDCRSRSWNEGHKYECPIMFHLINMEYVNQELLPLKILFKAKFQYSTLDNMFANIEQIEKETVVELKGFTTDSDNTRTYDSNSYAPIHVFNTYSEYVDITKIHHICTMTAALLHMVVKYTTFFSDHPKLHEEILCLDLNDYVWRVGGLLMHIIMLSMFCEDNMQVVDLKSEDSRLSNLASLTYPFYNLFNHSCAPNIGRTFHGSTLIAIALRHIKKGEQIFTSYGPHYSMMPYEKRQDNLLDIFKFSCKCEACNHNWPLRLDLDKANPEGRGIKEQLLRLSARNVMTKFANRDNRAVYDVFTDLYNCIGVMAKFAPCKEHCNLENLIIFCWEKFYEN